MMECISTAPNLMKDVQSTHRNITSVIDQVRAGLPDFSPADTLIGVLPFYHIYGQFVVRWRKTGC